MLRLLFALLTLCAALTADEAASPVSPSTAAAPDLAALQARVEALEAASKKALRLKFEGYGQLRYDDQQYKVGSWNAPSSGAPMAQPVTNNVRGAYFKKAELKLGGEVIPSLDWVLGVDFAEGKLKDLGTVWKGLPMHFEGYTWTLYTGQFRQKFGAEPQMGSVKYPFHERSLMYGGAHPFANAALKTVGERVLGVHATHAHDYDGWGYDWGWSISDDANDQAKGSNTLGLAFPTQAGDENPTFTTRYGLKAFGAKAGVSWQRNSKNTQFMATNPAAQAYDETLGLDLRYEIPYWLWFQAEWLAQQGISGALGLFTRQEGYTLSLGFFPVGFLKRNDLEPTFRYERVTPMPPTPAAGWSPAFVSAATAGLNWNFGWGKTSVNYTAYAAEDNFGALGPVSLFTLQDQFAF